MMHHAHTPEAPESHVPALDAEASTSHESPSFLDSFLTL